ncbi:PTS lactose/cellobiose transporter subunit IIA [Aeromonas sobria]|jgi:PTS system cellobiose-specific IIA component|uniref:PTS lactose/cellobiose transporter subunit IIA n=1 Tax=Aeromonas sobria TaxID=646 RepID=UPI0026F0004D|nr:PTS lactose/cellobiose transporter subunit IIA [Aeromonas sobria]
MELEEQVMTLIVSAGSCRSMLMEAMRHSRNGEFEQAEQLVEQARCALHAAHAVQTQLIEADAGEGKLPVQIVMVHAQDHVMNAVLLMDLTQEMIAIHRRLPPVATSCSQSAAMAC